MIKFINQCVENIIFNIIIKKIIVIFTIINISKNKILYKT